MFIVTIENDGVVTEIHGDYEKLKSGKVVKGINSIDTFSFTMLPSNAGFNLIRDFTTLVKVYNTNKDRYEFMGRVLYSDTSMDESGLITKDVTCESYFGFLCDSQQTVTATKNWTVRGLFQHIIDRHNSQIEDYKRFTIGEVTVTDPNDNLYIGIQYANTWDTIKEKLLDKLGGEIQFRVVGSVTYIDYLTEIGKTSTTEIVVSRNMKSIKQEKDPSTYVTRLIPLGMKVGENDERLEITDVNGGKNYIDDEEGIAKYGIHVAYQEWDDVTKASNLLKKGQAWLNENNKLHIKYSITALDLSLLNLDMDDFEVHNYYSVKNPLLGIDDVARIIKKSIDVCEEVKSTIEVGENFQTFSDIQISQAQQAAEEYSKITKETNAIALTVKDLNGKQSEYSQKVDNITLSVSDDNSNAKIELKIGDEVVGTGTITLTGFVTFEGVEGGTTTINGGCLKTGKIIDQDEKNYWDLESGKIVLTDTEINGTGGSVSFTNCPIHTIGTKTWKVSNYTSADIETIYSLYISGNATAAQLEKYDFNLNGEIDSGDAVLLNRMLSSGQDGVSSWKCQLAPESEQSVLKVWQERTFGGTTTEVVAFLVRAGGVEVLSLHSAENMTIGEDKAVVCHAGNTGLTDNLLSDAISSSNESVSASYPVGVVGFWVSGYTSNESALAGTFVPIALCDGSTQFQFADESNFVSFTMQADESANKVTLTYESGSNSTSEIAHVYGFYYGNK